MICDGKTRHPSYAVALAQVKRTKARELEPYRCSECRGWHLGHGKRAPR